MKKAFYFSEIPRYSETPWGEVNPKPLKEVFTDWRWQKFTTTRHIKNRKEGSLYGALMGLKFLGIANCPQDIREGVGYSEDGNIIHYHRTKDKSSNPAYVLRYMREQKHLNPNGYLPRQIGYAFSKSKANASSWAVKQLKKLCRENLVHKKRVGKDICYFLNEK